MADGAVARALVLEAPRRLVVRELPLPNLSDDDALVRVAACALCGTDHEQYTGELAGGFAFVPGHETVGTIDAIGPRAAQRWGVAAGDRVAVEVFQSCRACPARRAGEYRRCARHGLADMYGFISVDREPGLWGGYTEYQYLAPDSMVLPVPGTSPGDVVAVLGPGFWPDMIVFKKLCVLGALGVDVTAYRAAPDLLASGRYPFASLPRRCVGLDDAEDLLATMAGERDDIPPVHGVLTP
jgi:threonine dehydrogenase-like Zn-dependent dehydrogenase